MGGKKGIGRECDTYWHIHILGLRCTKVGGPNGGFRGTFGAHSSSVDLRPPFS